VKFNFPSINITALENKNDPIMRHFVKSSRHYNGSSKVGAF